MYEGCWDSVGRDGGHKRFCHLSGEEARGRGGGRKKYPVRLGGANKFRWLI